MGGGKRGHELISTEKKRGNFLAKTKKQISRHEARGGGGKNSQEHQNVTMNAVDGNPRREKKEQST